MFIEVFGELQNLSFLTTDVHRCPQMFMRVFCGVRKSVF